jgi:hypothetical protein
MNINLARRHFLRGAGMAVERPLKDRFVNLIVSEKFRSQLDV